MKSDECQHKNAKTTALGAMTNTGWICSDCGALLTPSTPIHFFNATQRAFDAAIGKGVSESHQVVYSKPTLIPDITEAKLMEIWGHITGHSTVANPHAIRRFYIAITGGAVIDE